MKANYNVTGNDRKALVAAIENLTGDKAIYMRMPTCAYEIGDITVDKEGGVTCEDADKLERIIHNLIADGFTPEDTEEVESDDEATGLTVSLPLDKVAVGNLTNLLTAKERLIKKALGIDDLGIEVTEDTVSFPWFTEMPEPDEVKAYTHFIAALGKMSRDLKRISATEKEVDNEKYAFRCFLLRLGFIGNEYKAGFERYAVGRIGQDEVCFLAVHELFHIFRRGGIATHNTMPADCPDVAGLHERSLLKGSGEVKVIIGDVLFIPGAEQLIQLTGVKAEER